MQPEQDLENALPQQVAASCRKHAGKWKVSAAVHPQDFLFRFILGHHAFARVDDAVQYYFDDGRRSAELLRSILQNDLRVNAGEKQALLEFASGYGAVTRHLKVVFPAFDIASADIHPAANEFIARELHAKAIQSTVVPECFDPGGEYDLVFALSFFSHMPAATWSRWLLVLARALRAGGHLVFTTHGAASLRELRLDASLGADGFLFRPESEQDDLDTEQYGTTFTSLRFVAGQVEAIPGCELRLVRTGFWWGHQDLYVATRITEAASSPAADGSDYHRDAKVQGNVESVSVRRRQNIDRERRTLHVAGWLAPDIKATTAADNIIVILHSDEGRQYSCDAAREDRHDVAEFFANPALVKTGFTASVDISDLKGSLTLLLAVRCGADRRLCPTVAVPLSSFQTDG